MAVRPFRSWHDCIANSTSSIQPDGFWGLHMARSSSVVVVEIARTKPLRQDLALQPLEATYLYSLCYLHLHQEA